MIPALLSLLLAAEPTPPPTFLRLRAVGDTMLGTSVPDGYLPPDDGAHLLDAVAPLLADADLTFANLEGPLCDGGATTKCRKGANCFAFRTPTRYGRYLTAMGLDLASVANNHVMDFGEGCWKSTQQALDSLHIAWSGPPGTVGTVEVKGKRVGLVAFQTCAYTNDVNDLAAAKALVAQAKQTHDLVIVSFHGGAEGTRAGHVVAGAERFLGENRGDLRPFTHGVIDAGADLVLGHGPHVLRGLEVYRGRLIAYSMGNFATYGRFDLSGPLAIAGIFEVELAADGTFVRGKVTPTRLEGKGVPALDDQRRAITMLRDLTQADFPKTGARVSEDGVLLPPAEPLHARAE